MPTKLSTIRLHRDIRRATTANSIASLITVFLCCSSIILYCTYKLNWVLSDAERAMANRLDTFFKNHPVSALGSNPFDSVITSNRLEHFYPYHEVNGKGKPYPLQKDIWQMWKKPPTAPDFPYGDLHELWKNMNPNFKYHFKTNEEIIDIVKQEFKDTVPEIAETLDLLPSMILKSDFSRYVLLYMYGGSYGDLDVVIHKPMEDWFDTNRNVGFVCGHEDDINERGRALPRRYQIQSWFFKSKARHPILRKLISTIVKITFETMEKGGDVNYGDKSGSAICTSVHIMDWTGPGIFSDIIFTHLNSIENPTIMDTNVTRWNFGQELIGPGVPRGMGINWKTTTGIQWPVLISDVVIYPHFSTKSHPQDNGLDYLVQHLFSGSWKPS